VKAEREKIEDNAREKLRDKLTDLLGG